MGYGGEERSMRGRRGRGGQHASVVSVASCAIYGSYIDAFIHISRTAHIHFP